MIRVVIDGMVKRFEGVAVLDGLSLEVRPGELTFLAGPSGAGKTTLARLISGIDAPDAGEIYFDGRPMREVPPLGRRVGLVFQGDALWPHRTAAENVGYGLKVRGVARGERRRRVAEALGLLRIDSLADRLPAALEPVHRRRVALARALVIDPEVLVLDDPTASLEGHARDEWHDELRRLHAEARATTLVLTADPGEALALADRVAVLDLGRVLQVGSPAEVYSRPADPFVAQYLGPANLLQAHLETADAGGGAIVRTPLGRLSGVAASGLPSAGSPVVIIIRPESLALGGTPPPGANRFHATVERQALLGELRRVHLRGPNDWPLTALALNGVGAELRDGQGLTVSVPSSQVLVLPSRLGGAPATVPSTPGVVERMLNRG
jgi:ABC-type Fe3+/spermidine/putrescine transport system ATPase subunit